MEKYGPAGPSPVVLCSVHCILELPSNFLKTDQFFCQSMFGAKSKYFSQSCVTDFFPSGGKTCCFKPDFSQSFSEE